METVSEINYINALLPMAGIVFIIAIGVVLLTQQFRKNLYRQKLEQEELKNLHQKELLASSIQVQEQERKRIAQDLHDELGAALSITRMHLMQVEQKNNSGDEVFLTSLQNIRGLVETSLANMRRISHELMPPQLETFGLVKTLEAVALQVNRAGEISLDINAEAELPELSWPVKLGLYRINMELLNNTVKHAAATTITITLACEGKHLVCNYSDNGKGISGDTPGSGLGHKGIEGRVASLGGTFAMGNNAQGGYQALIKIPLAG